MKRWDDKCGVFGVFNHKDASRLTYLGLFALQHRGQEAAGIVSLDQGRHCIKRGLGLVADVFSEEDFKNLSGRAAIGHVRYSTTGGNLLGNAQPLSAQLKNGPIAVGHNGNIVNAHILRKELQNAGAIFHGSNDTEVLLHLLAQNRSDDLVKCLEQALEKLDGAFSLVLLSKQSLFAIRDPYGFRPLVLGQMPDENDSWVVASETCAFDLIGAKFVREIEPGEIFWVDSQGTHSVQMQRKNQRASCVFEHVYFARPDSIVFGRSVYESRKSAGRILAQENPLEADVVIPVPDSGVPAAIGYSQESGVPFELGIIRNHYVGRTFIEPEKDTRNFGVRIKLNPQMAVLKGKRVVVIDDSLVRGTTSKKIIGLIRQAGAKEVHLRIAAPPTMGPCYYGVDTPQKKELIASRQSVAEICRFVEADSLAYLSLSGLQEAVGQKGKASSGQGYCSACFDLKYPTDLYESENESENESESESEYESEK